MQTLCVAWRQAQRRIWKLPYNCHTAILERLSGTITITVTLFKERKLLADEEMIGRAIVHTWLRTWLWFEMECVVCPQMSFSGTMCLLWFLICLLADFFFFYICFIVFVCTSSTIYNNNNNHSARNITSKWLYFYEHLLIRQHLPNLDIVMSVNFRCIRSYLIGFRSAITNATPTDNLIQDLTTVTLFFLGFI